MESPMSAKIDGKTTATHAVRTVDRGVMAGRN
jgi:hypothetical protein